MILSGEMRFVPHSSAIIKYDSDCPIEWMAVDDILNTWVSSDGWGYLRDILRMKRKDYSYKDAMEFLSREGFTQPLCYSNAQTQRLAKILDETREMMRDCDGELDAFSLARSMKIAQVYDEPLSDMQGDGHHRLAAAIDLGYKMIPYINCQTPFLRHSGTWHNPHNDRLLHPDNFNADFRNEHSHSAALAGVR